MLWIYFLFGFLIDFNVSLISIGSMVPTHDLKIGAFVELNSNEQLVLRCKGNFVYSRVSIQINKSSHYKKGRLERIEEIYDDYHKSTELVIHNVEESDTGPYSCVSHLNNSHRETIYLFVYDSSVFLKQNQTATSTFGYEFENGYITVPCRTTKFMDVSDIELYANDTRILFPTSSSVFDPRFGFNFTKNSIGLQAKSWPSLTCRYQKNVSDVMNYFFTNEIAPKYQDSDFLLHWVDEEDWPYVGLNYNISCQLDYIGTMFFDPRSHVLDITCSDCSNKYKKYNTVTENTTTVTIHLPNLALGDSKQFICSWTKKGTGKALIVNTLNVSETKFQIRVLKKTDNIIKLSKRMLPFSIHFQFDMYPTGKYSRHWSRRNTDNRTIAIHNDDMFEQMPNHKNGHFGEILCIYDTKHMEELVGTYTLVIKHLDAEYKMEWNISIDKKVETFPVLAFSSLLAGLTVFLTGTAVIVYKRKTRKLMERTVQDICKSLKKINGINVYKNEKLSNKEKIGAGQFGIVQKGSLSLIDGNVPRILTVAVKQNKTTDLKQLEMLLEEAMMLSSIGTHPNVLSLIGVVKENLITHKHLMLITEYADNGSLKDYLTNRQTSFRSSLPEPKLESGGEKEALLKETLSFDLLISFARQIAMGMAHLAKVPCVHRDLACRNVLLTNELNIKIGDFGLSKKFNGRGYYRTKKSREIPIPYKWMPAEAIEEFKFTEKSDVWAYGICLFEIFSIGETPFPGVCFENYVDHIKGGNMNERPEFCPEIIYELMKICWEVSPDDRPTFSDCVQFFDANYPLQINQQRNLVE